MKVPSIDNYPVIGIPILTDALDDSYLDLRADLMEEKRFLLNEFDDSHVVITPFVCRNLSLTSPVNRRTRVLGDLDTTVNTFRTWFKDPGIDLELTRIATDEHTQEHALVFKPVSSFYDHNEHRGDKIGAVIDYGPSAGIMPPNVLFRTGRLNIVMATPKSVVLHHIGFKGKGEGRYYTYNLKFPLAKSLSDRVEKQSRKGITVKACHEHENTTIIEF